MDLIYSKETQINGTEKNPGPNPNRLETKVKASPNTAKKDPKYTAKMPWCKSVYLGITNIQLKRPKKKIIPQISDNKKLCFALLPAMERRNGTSANQAKNDMSKGGKLMQSNIPLKKAKKITDKVLNNEITKPVNI